MDRFFDYLRLLRVHQWLKNLMLFFPPFLGGTLMNQGIIQKGILPFTAFSLASSAGYIVNDIIDIEADRNHPAKSLRPIASGSVPVSAARVIAFLLAIAALVTAYRIQTGFLLILVSYMAVSLLYTTYLKQIAVVDIFCIAAGFLFRLESGGEVFGVNVSQWLFLSVLLLSLFLSAGKRLSEKLQLSGEASVHRRVLDQYPEGFLDGILYMTGGAVLVTYTMYTISHSALLYTVPLCCFGLMRYILRIKSGSSGDPSEALLRDPWLFAVGSAWAILTGWGIYGK